MVDKEKILYIMQPQLKQIILQWDNEGQIIETQFDFAYQNIFKTSIKSVYEIIIEKGGHCVHSEKKETINLPICSAVEVINEGWIYYFYDPNMLNLKTAQENVHIYFNKKQ